MNSLQLKWQGRLFAEVAVKDEIWPSGLGREGMVDKGLAVETLGSLWEDVHFD